MRVSANLFSPMIERVEAKLEGWKSRYLSLAGRRTLAQSVFNTIPFYAMQTTYLPLGKCDDIERRIKKFIWGNRIHLVSWDMVMKDKDGGGLGIRRLREMNIAFLVKLGWRLITE